MKESNKQTDVVFRFGTTYRFGLWDTQKLMEGGGEGGKGVILQVNKPSSHLRFY